MTYEQALVAYQNRIADIFMRAEKGKTSPYQICKGVYALHGKIERCLNAKPEDRLEQLSRLLKEEP